MKQKSTCFALLLAMLCCLLTACEAPQQTAVLSLDEVPAYSDAPYVVINGNMPYFDEDERTETTSYESYSSLDSLGRCGVAVACIGTDLMPTEARGDISSIKPSGWQTARYEEVDGTYLYNRCHLIGFQLTGENANRENLITGTRYLNVEGMLPFENEVADYIEETDNHVLYRVTPVFEGDDLVASGVLMEAWSVEDAGEEICFNVFCYNVQPEITIDYATGNSALAGDDPAVTTDYDYIINTNSGKFHKPDCYSVGQITESAILYLSGTRQDMIDRGYEPCGRCKP